MISDSPHWVPSLAPETQLYLDSQHQRWVVRAPHQVVFVDPLSLDVLRACDGKRSVAKIALLLDKKRLDRLCKDGSGRDVRGSRTGSAWLDIVNDIVRHFEARGVLHCRLQNGALAGFGARVQDKRPG